ncbi:MAG: AzlC family ABC transporter permease [Evtepia sp.]
MNEHAFRRGFRDGIPIFLGYFTVSLSLGIVMKQNGISPLQGLIMSLTNMTSAGEFAGVTVVAAGSGLVVMATLQLVINARYLLMSCALSQRLDESVSLGQRLLLGLTVTDEIFGISIAQTGKLSPLYSIGALCAACPGWTFGTFFGALMGSVLPARVVTALGVALYGMLIAVFIPPAKNNKIIAGAVILSMLLSWLVSVIPICSNLSSGMKIIILTVIISGGAAILFPVKEEKLPDES